MAASVASAAAAAEHLPAEPLYHLVQSSMWEDAKSSGQPYFPPTYQQDGFIHLTKDPQFLLGIGNHFYRQVRGDFLLLVLDPTKLTSKVVFEPAAPVGAITSEGLAKGKSEVPLFPHLYGTIDYGAVQAELAVRRSEAGDFLSIEGLQD